MQLVVEDTSQMQLVEETGQRDRLTDHRRRGTGSAAMYRQDSRTIT